MAPALIETPTAVPDRAVDHFAEEQWKKDNKQGVNYKEAFQQGAATTKYDVELYGTEKHAPAKYPNYLPYWDNVVSLLRTSASPPFENSLRITETRNTLRPCPSKPLSMAKTRTRRSQTSSPEQQSRR